MRNSGIAAALLLVTLVGVVGAAPAPASKHPAHRMRPATSDAVLASQAKVSMAVAKATALSKVPGGKVKSSELEREHGKLIYSFDIQVKGKSGIEEVNVDAIDGSVVSVGHEAPKAEQKEARQEKAEAGKDSTKAGKTPHKR